MSRTTTKSQNGKTGENKNTTMRTPKQDKQLHGERTPRKFINWREYNEALVRRGPFTL